MSMTPWPDGGVYLQVNFRTHRIWAISERALRITQYPKRSFPDGEVGSLVLDRRGVMLRIAQIELGPPTGESGLKRLVSRVVFQEFQIRVRFEEADNSEFAAVKELVYAEIDRDWTNWIEADTRPDALLDAVRAARTPLELYESLPMPEPEDCLDVL